MKISIEDYYSECTPATEFGWHLKNSVWGKGFATKGAKKYLDYAFNKLNLEK